MAGSSPADTPQFRSRTAERTLNPAWGDEFALTDSFPDFQTLDRANQVPAHCVGKRIETRGMLAPAGPRRRVSKRPGPTQDQSVR